MDTQEYIYEFLVWISLLNYSLIHGLIKFYQVGVTDVAKNLTYKNGLVGQSRIFGYNLPLSSSYIIFLMNFNRSLLWKIMNTGRSIG